MKNTILWLFLFLLLGIACNGKARTRQTKPTPAHSVLDTQGVPAAQPYVDPLFFIEGQLCQHVRKIFEDSRGHLWFGTNVYGLMYFNGDTLRYIGEEEGVDGGRVTGIVEDAQGNIWFGMYKGLYKFDGTTFSHFAEKEGLHNNEIWSLFLDKEGTFWVGTNEGVSLFDGKTFTSLSIPKAAVKEANTIYHPDRITSITQDNAGNMWFGTDGFGISIYDGKTFTYQTTETGLPDNVMYDLMTDTQGNIWIGTFFGGVSMYNGTGFTNFTQDSLIHGVEAGGFFEDKQGNIWFAAENHGVYRYNGDGFTHLYAEEGLKTNGILSIYQDTQDRFWFGGWGGLFRYDGKSFSSVTKQGPWSK